MVHFSSLDMVLFLPVTDVGTWTSFDVIPFYFSAKYFLLSIAFICLLSPQGRSTGDTPVHCVLLCIMVPLNQAASHTEQGGQSEIVELHWGLRWGLRRGRLCQLQKRKA